VADTRKPRSAVVALPGRRPAVSLRLARFLPSGRSLLLGFGLVALAVGSYVGARETSAFAVQDVEVTGPRPLVVRRVEQALASLEGKSLLSVNAAAIDGRLEALPDVKLVSYDRAFPHTARIVVWAERPVAVLRRGSGAWLISERGRILQRLGDARPSRLPRIWVAESSVPGDGALLSDDEALQPALTLGRVLSTDRSFFGGVSEARELDGDLVLVLRSGTEVRLGGGDDIALKVAVAGRILGLVEPGAEYVDVSVPERPVVLGNPQVSG
jgi:cell division protein FtsQ